MRIKLDVVELEAYDYDEKIEIKYADRKQERLRVFSFRCDLDDPDKIKLLSSVLLGSDFEFQSEGQEPMRVKRRTSSESYRNAETEHHYDIELEEYRSRGDGVQTFIDAVRRAARLGIDVWDAFAPFRVPYAYQKLQQQTVEDLEKSKRSIMIDEYSKQKTGEKPLVLDKQYYEGHKRDLSVENVSYLRNAEEFYRMAIAASPEAKPILYYYSWVTFFSFLSRTHLRFDRYAKAHGIVANIARPDDMTLEFRPEGFWPRIVDTLTILGFNSVFSPVLLLRKGETIVVRKNLVRSLASTEKIKIGDLDLHSTDQYSKDLAKEYGLDYDIDTDKIREVSDYLVDYLILFGASTAARYNPIVWNEILKGEKTGIINRIEKAYLLYPEFVDFVYRELFRKALDALQEKAESGQSRA